MAQAGDSDHLICRRWRAPRAHHSSYFSPDHFLAYAKRLPFKLPVMEYQHRRAALPQWYADQFGWNGIVAETAQAWNGLAPAERSDCAIFAQDYGQAGAIDFLGRRYGLPPALSGHQTYFCGVRADILAIA